MYQLLAESFFGLKRTGNRLTIKPCIPDGWNSYKIRYMFADTEYHLYFDRNMSSEEMSISLDGVHQQSGDILLLNDKTVHELKVVLPALSLKRKAQSLKPNEIKQEK